MVIGLVAVLKAGAGYLPLDPTYPAARLQYQIDDAGVEIVVADGGGVDCAGVDVIDQSADGGSIALDTEDDPFGAAGENLAYIIYTSGTSGEPKGVMVERAGIENYLSWVSDELFETAARPMPLVSSLAFDASVKQVLGPLMNGGTVRIVDRGGLEGIAELFDETGVRLNCVPSLWRIVLDAVRGGEAAAGAEWLESLLLGGEPFDVDLVRETEAIVPGARIWNLYGPTEGTINATAGRVTGEGAVTMGRPIRNVRAYVLDGAMRPVPVGVEGELYVGGTAVSRGYRGRPGMTAGRYVPDPFGMEGDRLYRTGDRVRRNEDGELLFAGRSDDQVKVRGYRIEPVEVEAALAAHAAVREAAVDADRAGGNRLIAYVVTEDGRDATGEELGAFLGRTLPAYMVPSAYVRMDELPRTRGGKIDRAALPPPGTARSALSGIYTPPRNALETLLADLWADLLRLDRIGIHDNFFTELGGHSLLAAQLRSRIDATLGFDPPLRLFFEAPTVASFAVRIAADEAERERIERTAEHIVRLERMTEEEAARMLASRDRASRD
jgi:amino acid adenylation domain-containing protein